MRTDNAYSSVLLVEWQMIDSPTCRPVYIALDHRIVGLEGNVFNADTKFIGGHASHIR
jgi:hypothetical protein